jgi:transposase
MSQTDAAAAPLTAEHLPDDLATLKGMIVELVATLQERERDNQALRHRLDLLLKRLYGPRGERYDPQQPWLFADLAGPPDRPAASGGVAEPDPPLRRARPHGRRRLPPHLPREARHHVLSEAERLCTGCGQPRIDIGVDRSEQLDYRPASLRVIEHVVHKYVCPRCSPQRSGQGPPAEPESVVMPAPPPEPEPVPPAAPSAEAAGTPTPAAPAPPEQTSAAGAVVRAAVKPAMPIAKGLPGPGLLAHLIVSKYVDHLPLHRLERVYERQGLFVPRSTLCDWLAACGRLLGPLYERLVAGVLLSRALHTDDTPVKLQDPVAHALSTARFWVYLGDAGHPYNVFDFTVNRKRDGPQQFLASYHGYLHADAFSGYDGLYLPEAPAGSARIIEVACNAHARRKFYEARSSDTLRAHQALAYYGQLYELERSAAKLEFNDTQKLQMRQDLSLLILEKFHQWLEGERQDVLPKSPLGQAIGYTLHNWTALVRYTEAGFLAIDNNVAEREMKRIAIGRKNWLFVGSPQGGRTAAVLVSFTSTCNRLGIEPWAYLQDVLAHLPTTAAGQLDDLLPDKWQAARAATANESSAGSSPSVS